jgi:hypothetical protein
MGWRPHPVKQWAFSSKFDLVLNECNIELEPAPHVARTQ